MSTSGKNSINIKKTKLIIIEILIILITCIIMIPIYYLVVTTFKTPQEATLSPLGLPSSLYFEGYINAWKAMKYPLVFKNTMVITATSITAIILISSMASYTLARKRHSNKYNIIFVYILMGLMVPFQMIIIALYKVINSLGLMDNILAVILINIAVYAPVATLFVKNFIVSSVPLELEEAATIDGCSVMGLFWRITFPLLKPVIATLTVMYSMNIWNDFMTPLLFLHSADKQTILLAVNTNIGQFSTDWTNLFPMLLLGVIPLVIFFLFMQKFIIKGITAGAVKG